MGEKLTPKDRIHLSWLASNPGSWGGHADCGKPSDDREILSWLRRGLIELRPQHKRLNKYVVSENGYHLTDLGHAALATGGGDEG